MLARLNFEEYRKSDVWIDNQLHRRVVFKKVIWKGRNLYKREQQYSYDQTKWFVNEEEYSLDQKSWDSDLIKVVRPLRR